MRWSVHAPLRSLGDEAAGGSRERDPDGGGRAGGQGTGAEYVNPHAFRRKWEEVRRHLPLKDRMDASSRRDERSLHSSYLRCDTERVLQVMDEPKKLRGAMVLTG